MTSFIGDLLGVATASGDKAALIGSDRALSYGALVERVAQIAGALTRRGVGQGSVVGLSVADEIDHMILTLATLACGASQVTLATYETADLRARIAAQAGVTHVVAESEAYRPAEAAEFMLWDELADGGAPRRDWTGGVIILRTSGTTGGIKLIGLTDAQVARQADDCGAGYERHIHTRAASVEHNVSKRHALYTLWAGGTMLFQPQGAVRLDLAYGRERGATLLGIGHVHAMSLIASEWAEPLPDLQITLSGSIIPLALRQALQRKLGCTVRVLYGATECGIVSLTEADGHEHDDVGPPAPGVEVEIVGPDGLPVEAGTTGELRVKCPGSAEGYLNAPEDTAARFREGWFWPGDVGHMTAEGRLVVSGRKDDMITLSGMNIFPGELEEALLAHPDVHMAAVVGLPSKVFGHIPVAAVELRSGAAASEAELSTYVREKLALRAPRRIKIVPALPRDAGGKIARRDIPAIFLKEQVHLEH